MSLSSLEIQNIAYILFLHVTALPWDPRTLTGRYWDPREGGGRVSQGVVHCTLSVCCHTVLPSYLAVSVSPSSLSPVAFSCIPAVPPFPAISTRRLQHPELLWLSFCQLYVSVSYITLSLSHSISLSLCQFYQFYPSVTLSAFVSPS